MVPSDAEVFEYVKQQFAPELMLLGGSRARGMERADSDWDIYLFGMKNGGTADECDDERIY